MWNLSALPIEDHGELLDAAFPIAEGSLPTADRAIVLAKYLAYKQLGGRPYPVLLGTDVDQALHIRMHDAYSMMQDGRRLAHTRSSLKLLAETCPYCGFGPVEDLDHLLQRAHFRLFSIFPLNLVPCCATCNRGKPKKPVEDAKKQQIHVYLEDLTKLDFLRAEVQMRPDNGGLRILFSIAQCDGMSDDIYSRLAHHLVEFDLQTRYEKQVNIFLGELQFPIVSTFELSGSAGLSRFCESNAVALGKRFGINDWRVAVMRGLSACEEFCSGGFKTALGLID
ncbi:HNH endonuclease signature motif containing protein [Janthinobacterium sp. NKUCC08_JDC]|uniref:HNH endonuclease signature motif containing protein n=1 Tax=Janthinobacterium sp. NKUCC08_JDC TaxID=2842122 RepID=UPI001C5AFBFB|nr:HNH endonuclease signature motif containing protein [Janthinobacterium sp. NKUCC08_JDC]MBW3499924.1 hypothetical protein [Janthinobacterium sp. NKUCC08_JDC]